MSLTVPKGSPEPLPRSTDEAVPAQARPGVRGAVRHALETSPFPILLVSLVGIVLLSVFGPSLVVGDTWLTLMAVREGV